MRIVIRSIHAQIIDDSTISNPSFAIDRFVVEFEIKGDAMRMSDFIIKGSFLSEHTDPEKIMKAITTLFEGFESRYVSLLKDKTI